MEMGDGEIDIDAFLSWLNNEIKANGTQKVTAEKFGLSPQFLNDILQRHRKPGEMTLAMMGWRRVVRYEKVEK